MIQVSDAGRKPLTASLDLIVTVLDLNDETPTSPSTSLHFQVAEDAPAGHVVGYVGLTTSSGTEAGENAFAIVSGNEDGYFVVDPSNGMLVTTRPLDREYRAEFALEVVSIMSGEQVRILNVFTNLKYHTFKISSRSI